MKRFGRIYDSIFTAQNIQRAIKNVAKGKKDRREVNKVLINLEDTIKAIQDNPHISGDYKPKTKIDQSSGKTREILEPKFYPDQIIHHALCQVIEPAMMRGMYKYCCGSVKKRGMLYASKYIRRARSFMSYYGYIMNTNSRFIEKKYFQTFSMKEIRLKVKGETL